MGYMQEFVYEIIWFSYGSIWPRIDIEETRHVKVSNESLNNEVRCT
jgi:hypothetical protein